MRLEGHERQAQAPSGGSLLRIASSGLAMGPIPRIRSLTSFPCPRRCPMSAIAWMITLALIIADTVNTCKGCALQSASRTHPVSWGYRHCMGGEGRANGAIWTDLAAV